MPDTLSDPPEPTARPAHEQGWPAKTRAYWGQASGWTQRRFQKGHAGRIAAWSFGGLFVFLVTLLIILGAIDWNLFKGPVARTASALSGRPVAIDGDLDVKIWSFHPRVDVNGLRIGNPPWAKNEKDIAHIGRASAALDLGRTLTGAFTLDFVEIDQGQISLVRAAPGKTNWSFGSGEKPLRLPVIRKFVTKNGHVEFEDRSRNLKISADFFSNEGAQDDPEAAARPFHLYGNGKFNGRIFKLDFAGAPLVNVDRSRPYAFNADLIAGGTRVRAGGRLAKPFDFGSYNARLDVRGEDLSDLYYITGLALPNTPPYHLAGILTRRRNGYDLTKINGIVGDSDLAGTLHVDKKNDRPYLTGEAHTNSLDFDDLLTILGAPPSVKHGETASPDQRAQAARMAASDTFMPDATLDLKRVRGMDANFKYSAAKVKAEGWPLRAFIMTINLDHGLLKIDPMALTLTQGKLAGAATIDAREQTPDVHLDARLTGSRLESWVGAAMKDQPISGPLAGRIQLHGRGNTVRKAAATADGVLSFVAPRGEVRKSLAELTGIDLTKGLGLLWSKDNSVMPVRCAVADFTVKNGVAHRRLFVVDTEDVLILGEGDINLGAEALDLRIQGNPKEPRLIRIRAPITITGHLRSPKIGVDTSAVAGQGAGAALATLLAPIAIVLPFIDVGLADDADCGALLSQARVPTATKKNAK